MHTSERHSTCECGVAALSGLLPRLLLSRQQLQQAQRTGLCMQTAPIAVLRLCTANVLLQALHLDAAKPVAAGGRRPPHAGWNLALCRVSVATPLASISVSIMI